ncbi:uncharacterized protein isoform X3 [Salmo salar]|uniref:Uncharacterized protein isoform X3 n=1 Tax=Salmo salar TaxID=8030 RepID=A0ABM3CI05_SALSA|nr:uncharacterized protein LOC106563869 isoform X3 [Salmo salar]
MLRYWTPRTQMRGVERLIFLFWLLQGVPFIDGVEEADNEIDYSADSDDIPLIDGVEEADNERDHSTDSDDIPLIDGVEEADNERDHSTDSDDIPLIDGVEEADNERDHSTDSDDIPLIDGVEEADNERDHSTDSDDIPLIDGVEEADNERDHSTDSNGDLSVLLGAGAAGMGLLAVLALTYRRMHVKRSWNLNPENTPELMLTYLCTHKHTAHPSVFVCQNNCVANEEATEETTAEHVRNVEPIFVEP